MLRPWDRRSLTELLEQHDLAGAPEEPFPNDGWSGSVLTQLRRGDERFILKRSSRAHDWIARHTQDRSLREAVLAASGVVPPAPVVLPHLGAAADGDQAAVLMPDLSRELIAWERPAGNPGVDPDTLDRVLRAVAALHAGPWHGLPDAVETPWPWCPLRERLTLLTRPTAEGYRDQGLPVGERFLTGWDAFDRRAPAGARRLMETLAADPAPLLAALDRLPAATLHGDLKLANVALLDDGRVALIDWQMLSLAPAAVELGWLLVSNVALLPEPPDRVLERYRAMARGVGGERVLGDWATQVDLTWIVGLLLRGWRKGLDAEAGVRFPWGGDGAADLAWWCDRAVSAADRRL